MLSLDARHRVDVCLCYIAGNISLSAKLCHHENPLGILTFALNAATQFSNKKGDICLVSMHILVCLTVYFVHG